jgi:hypothetical protein
LAAGSCVADGINNVAIKASRAELLLAAKNSLEDLLILRHFF